MTDVTVPVPDDRVAEFYTFFGSWLEGSLTDATPVAQRAGEKAWNRDGAPWGQSTEDMEKAERVWRRISSSAKDVFGLFLDHPGHKYTGEAIAQKFGMKHGVRSVAGTLSWPGKYCIEVGRQLLSEFDEDEESGESFYWMTEETAKLFNTVRANVERAV